MRYSRFRSAMLGIEPTRRNRTNQSRNRVTKNAKKKGDTAANTTNSAAHPKRDPDDEPETPAGRIKQEPRHSESPQTLRHETPMTMMAPSPRVKEEQLMFPILDQQQHHHQSSQQQSQIFNLADMQAARMQMRLLTPESDVLQYTTQHAHSHSHSPASDVLLDASAASPFDFEPAHHSHHQHEWHHHQHHQSPYAAGAGFGGVYGADGYSTAAGAAFGESQDTGGHHHQMHQHHHHDHSAGVHHHGHHGVVVPDALGLMLERHGMEGGDGQGMVKHEDWDHGAF